MNTLIWFRDDLRTLDHPPMEAACADASSNPHAVFLLTPASWREHEWGPPRVAYLLKTLEHLASDLDALGIPLHVLELERYEDAPDRMEELALELGVQGVHAGIEYGVNERRRDQQVGERLKARGIEFRLHHTQTILPVDEIKTGSGTAYRVFTPFRKAWEKRFEHFTRTTQDARTTTAPSNTPSSRVPTSVTGFEPWERIDDWPAGTAAGEARLEHFLDTCIARYSTDRDRPDFEGTSTLSPWLAVGSLSPRMCMTALVERYGAALEHWPEGPRTWQSELVWREFYRHVMDAFPRVSRANPMQGWTRGIPWRDAPGDLEAWKQGNTGIEIVDAAMHQLARTGWMHNRTRMIVSMFLTKNLLIDWREGERHFSRHLVDYDFPSNNGGWQWAASTGTDAAPYFRIFNPDTQAQRFDPDGAYRRKWLPQTRNLLSSPIVDLKSSRTRAIEVFKSCREAAGA